MTSTQQDWLRTSRIGDRYLERGHKIAGKYVIESVLGEGATSVVYVARREGAASAQGASRLAHEDIADEESEPPEAPSLVALKVIHRNLCEDPQIVGRFQREATILKRLEGPHVLRVYETLQDDGRLVLVLEYVASTPLDQHLAKAKPLPVATAVEITLQVCAGLAAAHASGVVHRDLKPANVLYATDGADDRLFVKVADFGLAKLVHGDKMVTGLTEHDMIFGTPEYMAPEQARGDDVDARADLYAAGIMLYEMLTGDVPFHGRSPMVTMTAHLTQDPEPLRKRRPDGAIPAALEAVVLRVLSKDPASRYPSARAFAEALLAAETHAHVIATTAPADALSDTDLNVSLGTTLTHSPTIPSEEPLVLPRESPSIHVNAVSAPSLPAVTPAPSEPHAGLTLADDPSMEPMPPTVRAGPPWLWITVGVIAAIAAIALGIAAGTH